MWVDAQVGSCVLVECQTRWYLGIVSDRTPMTLRLDNPLCGHSLGDMGKFMDGEPREAELTPMPRSVEINAAVHIISLQSYPLEYYEKIRKRTHAPIGD